MNKIEAMKRFIFLQLILWTVIGAMAQNSPISTLSIQLEEQVKTNAKQKTFIKTDKDIYAPGEKIWFKAEVINMINHRFENESSLVMMLKAESGEIIVDGKYLISDGVASSQITIPSWANEGNAYLIAYTPTTTINNDASLLAIQPIFINQLRRNDYNINTHFENKIYNPGDEIKLQVEIIPITPSAKKVKATRVRRRERKNVERGQAHISSTFNNTMVTLTDLQGNVLSWASAGQLGFRGSRKSTPFAAQQAAEEAAQKAMEHGLKSVEEIGRASCRERV